MTFLGADPDALGRLRWALRDAVDQFDLIRRRYGGAGSAASTEDPSPIEGWWTTTLEYWATRVERLACGVTDEVLARLDARAAERTWVIAQLLTHPTTELDAQLVELDQTIAELARSLHSHPHLLVGLVDELDPTTAALLLQFVPLDDDSLGEVATRILRRSGERPPPGDPRTQWTDRSLAGPNTFDLLVEVLAPRPAAARALVLGCADRPDLLLLHADRAESIAALLATALADADPGTAGAILRPLTNWTFTGGLLDIDPTGIDGADPRGPVAAAITPWLAWFGPRHAEFGWGRAEGRAAIRAVAADEVGLAALTDALGQWTARLGTEPLIDGEGQLDTRLIDDLAATTVLIERTLFDARIDRAVMDRRLTDVAFDIGELLLSKMSATGSRAERAGSALGRAGVRERLERDLERLGWLPPTVDQVRSEQLDLRDARTATTAVAAVVATVHHLVDAGRLPTSALDAFTRTASEPNEDCATAAVDRWLSDTIDSLDADPDDRQRLHAVRYAFVNQATIEARCDDPL